MKKVNSAKSLSELDNIKLDVGCGKAKQQGGWVGLDRRPLDGVDIVHDIEKIPWPLKDNSCHIILMSHIIEHVDPRGLLDIFDECWRLLKPNGQLLVATPYAGSYGAHQDPTHVRPGFTEATFSYFDPSHRLYEVYSPKPFRIVSCNYVVDRNLNVIMEALKDSGPPILVKKGRSKNGKRISRGGGSSILRGKSDKKRSHNKAEGK